MDLNVALTITEASMFYPKNRVIKGFLLCKELQVRGQKAREPEAERWACSCKTGKGESTEGIIKWEGNEQEVGYLLEKNEE
jgi:hypothetical protein